MSRRAAFITRVKASSREADRGVDPSQSTDREKSVSNAPRANAKCRSFLAQHHICLCDLIYCLGVNRSAFLHFGFQDTQNCEAFCLLILNGKAESPSNLRLE